MPLALLLAAGCLSTTGIVFDIDDGQIIDLNGGDDAILGRKRDTGLSLMDPAGGADSGDSAAPTPTGILLAWTDGTDRDDRPTALAERVDGGLLIGGYLGASPTDDQDQRAELIALQPDGQLAWRTTLATASASLVVDELLPTDDGGAWVCASALTATTLSPELGELPDSWSGSLTMVHVDSFGGIDASASLGVTSGGELAAGCGLDAHGTLVVDGSVDGGVLQLLMDGEPTTLADFGAHGFVATLAADGSQATTSTWRTGSQRRQSGAVRPDGSVVQLLRYSGDPGLSAGGHLLAPCPGVEVCTGIVSVDPDGQPAWTGTMGPGIGADAALVAAPDGGILLSADLGDSGLLPQASGDPIADGVGGKVIASWSPDLVLKWLAHVSDQAEITALDSTLEGDVLVGLWTGDAATLQVGDTSVQVDEAAGTLGLATIDPTGHTDWLWTAQGSGDAWPTALTATDTGVAVAAVFRGSITLALAGDEVSLNSLDSAGGLPTNDLAVFLLAPQR